MMVIMMIIMIAYDQLMVNCMHEQLGNVYPGFNLLSFNVCLDIVIMCIHLTSH